jgi:FlaA1/EpsC-like NDP-sugar epimerase
VDEHRPGAGSAEGARGLPGTIYRLAAGADNLSLRILDLGLVATAWILATLAGFEANPSKEMSPHLLWILAVAVFLQVVGHRLAGLYGPVWRYASVDEAFRLVVGVLGGAALATVWIGFAKLWMGIDYTFLTAPPVAVLLSLLTCGGVRFQSRLFALERQQSRSPVGLRTLIVGAGSAGAALAYELTHTEAARNVQVMGFVDDDPDLLGRSVRGLRVFGATRDLERICRDHQVDRVLVTEQAGNRRQIKEIVDIALRTKAQVKVLPLSSGRADGPLVRSLRDLDVTDLLGREHAPVDTDGIGEYLGGATVLITGAGGSIGSEIARQVVRFKPRRLLLLDRDETLLHDVSVGDLADTEPVLADICDEVRVRDLFERYRPDVVFHAAAQKHVPILERYPVEAVRTNVFGTWSLVNTAAEFGCSRFVHISTDKAADPCSVMGATKRAAEQVIFEVGRRHSLPYVAVRFGNVLGSRGSVVPTFLRQIVEGGPVTVTSEDMTRYFMTIPEAVSLVLQAGSMASDSRIYLLDMGEPVSILALARQLIRLAGLRPGDDIPIEITGTRPGERLHERLHDDAEEIEPSGHGSIASLNPKMPWTWGDLVDTLTTLRKSVDARDDDLVREQLEAMLRHGGVECELDGNGQSPGPDAAPAPALAPPEAYAEADERGDELPRSHAQATPAVHLA